MQKKTLQCTEQTCVFINDLAQKYFNMIYGRDQFELPKFLYVKLVISTWWDHPPPRFTSQNAEG